MCFSKKDENIQLMCSEEYFSCPSSFDSVCQHKYSIVDELYKNKIQFNQINNISVNKSANAILFVTYQRSLRQTIHF